MSAESKVSNIQPSTTSASFLASSSTTSRGDLSSVRGADEQPPQDPSLRRTTRSGTVYSTESTTLTKKSGSAAGSPMDNKPPPFRVVHKEICELIDAWEKSPTAKQTPF